jgi:Fuc2NAc and GlcNAc transferase
MIALSALPLILFTALASYLLSDMVRRHADRLGLIDIPNERSSHSTPIPRGGGIAIAFVFLATLPFLQRFTGDAWPLNLALYGAGSLITLVGFLDDRNHIPAAKRLVAHFLAAALVVYLIYFAPHADSHLRDPWLWLGAAGFAVFLVWLLNLYNFMDGIDVITGSETLTVTLSAATLSWYLLPADPSWLILLLLAASVAGFLVWNLPPARLFMGDSGSAFLGIIIGTLMIHAKQISEPLFYAWIILLGVYFVDATVTLLRRIVSGERFYQAHRTHAYQHAALRFNSHGKVSLAIALINLFWLLPVAIAVISGLLSGPVALVIAYLPLVITAFHFNAGKRQDAPIATDGNPTDP